jgi:transcription initiation factor TFIID subunit 5
LRLTRAGIQDGASIQQVPQASGSTDQNGQPILTRPKPSDTIDNVLEFLYRQGYDKAYKTFQEELAAVKDGEKPSQEATFRAPGPVSLDNHLKRNIPQASTVSASSLTDAITPEFIAQAEHIVERLSKQDGAKESEAAKGKETVGGNAVSLLDPAERVIGYKRFKLWIENSLDHWKVRFTHSDIDSLAGARDSTLSCLRSHISRSRRFRVRRCR